MKQNKDIFRQMETKNEQKLNDIRLALEDMLKEILQNKG